MGGVDLHSACGGVASEFAVVGDWVPKVIEVLPVVRCMMGVVVHGVRVELAWVLVLHMYREFEVLASLAGTCCACVA